MSHSFNNSSSRVLMALSGGVDSAVSARLLQQQGYKVHGLVIAFSSEHKTAVVQAQKAAAELDIPLTVANCEELFEQQVVLPFCRAYAKGLTPNPCVVCNPRVKFNVLAQQADKMGIHHIATGHYAQLAHTPHGVRVTMAASPKRDQSYMLYRLPQSILSRLILPIGGLEKPEIRRLAVQHGLSSAQLPDSQDICFIPDGNHAAYIAEKGFAGADGHFISPEGEKLMAHSGVHHYTVGQRKGLGVALGRPVFVKRILPSGDVQLTYAEDAGVDKILLDDIVAACGIKFVQGERYFVKIRSMAQPVPCSIGEVTENGFSLLLDTPQRAPAPGQHAVLYLGSHVAGGGVIQP